MPPKADTWKAKFDYGAHREWKIRSQRNPKAARIWNITSVDPENVKQFLVSKYAAQINAMGLNGGEISDDFDFFLRGVIDSLGILEMISSVEDEFNVRLDLSALDAEQLTILGPFSRYVAETALPA